MRILIKGMEMPKNCLQCPFRKFWDDEDQCLAKKNLWVKGNEIPPVCPLIELPPHGRLIDADALMKRVSYMNTEAYMDGVCYGVHPSLEYLDLLSEIIADTPTIIESEGE